MHYWSKILFLGIFILGLTHIVSSCKLKKVLVENQLSKDQIQAYQGSVNHILSKNNSPKPRVIKSPCTDFKNYFNSESEPYLNPMRHIRVNIHFINSLDSTANFNADTGIEYAKKLIYYANGKMRDNAKMNLPTGNDTPVERINYRYHLTPSPNIPGDQGIYFHYDENPFFINFGKLKNNYDKGIIKKYAINEDSILNIFYMVHPPDSLGSKTYESDGAGIALGNSLKLGVNSAIETKPWSYSGLLNHEIGHMLGLSHSWYKNDGCDDTPVHPNCWNIGPPPCDEKVSNNVMDYNSVQMAYTPCQIAKTNYTLAKVGSKKRRVVKKTWCQRIPENDIIVSDTLIWNRSVDFQGNIKIKDGGLLYVGCYLHMPENGSITVEKGGELILNNANLYNDCGLEWKGIRVKGDNEGQGKVYYVGTFEINNVTDDIIND